MTGQEVQKLSQQEIATQISDLRTKLFALRQKSVTDKVEDISEFKKARREIARLLTEQTARLHKATASSAPSKAAPEAKKVSRSFRAMRAVANPKSKTQLAKAARLAKQGAAPAKSPKSAKPAKSAAAAKPAKAAPAKA